MKPFSDPDSMAKAVNVLLNYFKICFISSFFYPGGYLGTFFLKVEI